MSPDIYPNKNLTGDMPQSCAASPAPKKRKTANSEQAGKIKMKPDEKPDHDITDKLPPFEEYKDEILKNGNDSRKYDNSPPVVCFFNQILIFQSINLIFGIPQFVLKIKPDFTFEAFHLGCKVYIPFLSKNHITKLERNS